MEINEIISTYKKLYNEVMKFCENYLDTVAILNETSKGEKAIAGGIEAVADLFFYSRSNLTYNPRLTYRTVNQLLLERHNKMKEPIAVAHELFERKIRDQRIVENCSDAMDQYISNIRQRVEIVSVGEKYYIKYLD